MNKKHNSTLKFSKELQESIANGNITGTVVAGHQNYKPGIIKAIGTDHNDKWSIDLHILEVRWTEGRCVEYDSVDYAYPQSFYDETLLDADSLVTVIYFVLLDQLDIERGVIDKFNNYINTFKDKDLDEE